MITNRCRSILRLIEEALKENTKEVHAIVPVPIASYLLNEKRAAVSAIESRQGDVRVIIVPNDEMQTPHYSVLRVRKGEETSTLSYLLPKLHEEEMALPATMSRRAETSGTAGPAALSCQMRRQPRCSKSLPPRLSPQRHRSRPPHRARPALTLLQRAEEYLLWRRRGQTG